MEVFRTITIGTLVGPLLYLYGGEPGLPTILGLDVAAVAFFALGHVLHHSHVWVYYGPVVGRVIVSPAQHQIHHSCLPRHLDKNFAEHWAVFDTLFGTLYLPQGRETLKLGLAGYQTQPHSGALLAFFRPFYDSAAAVFSLGQKAAGALRRWRQPHEQADAPITVEHQPGPG
jgi:sterol desaturase/sphingolipid hydroxylase (fatty acid hydroxylase superfamily)